MSTAFRLDWLRAVLEAENCVPAKLPKDEPVVDDTANASTAREEEDQQPLSSEELATYTKDGHEIGVIALPPANNHKEPVCEPITAPPEPDFPFDTRKGELAPFGSGFAPFIAVTKFCYKFVPPHLSQQVASALFDGNKIYDRRTWDLYYVANDYSGVRTFVSEHQLRELVDDINAECSTTLAITDQHREDGLVIDFDDVPAIWRPRWLGQCSSRTQYQAWVNQLEYEPKMPLHEGLAGRDRLEAFKAKMDDAAEISKNKSKAKRKEKQQEFAAKRREMTKQTLRLQRYLGLLPRDDGVPPLMEVSNPSAAPIDPQHPPQHAFDSDVIFIAIDVEANERVAHQITEVGVATLDTRDLHDIPPGIVGKQWHRYIRGRHFRIDEYKKHVNKAFVQGCPEDFEFGTSEFVPKAHIASVLASCFREPFSSPSPNTPPSHADAPLPARNIVIVGHDLAGDIAYCHKLGFSPLNRGNVLDTLDTVHMYRAHTRDPNPRALGRVLYDFDLEGWHLHNAGNDAVYTLQAMLAICVAGASERGTDAQRARLAAVQRKRRAELVQSAEERADDEAQGWEPGSDGDGGVPDKQHDRL